MRGLSIIIPALLLAIQLAHANKDHLLNKNFANNIKAALNPSNTKTTQVITSTVKAMDGNIINVKKALDKNALTPKPNHAVTDRTQPSKDVKQVQFLNPPKNAPQGLKVNIDNTAKQTQPILGNRTGVNTGKTAINPSRLTKPSSNIDNLFNRNRQIGNRDAVKKEGKIVHTGNLVIDKTDEKKPEDDLKDTVDFNIVWELGPAEATLSHNEGTDNMANVIDILKRANTWIKKYLRIKATETQIVHPHKGYYCNVKANDGKPYEGHMVILVNVAYEGVKADGSFVLAHAGPCESSVEGRVNIGSLTINASVFFNDLDPINRIRRVITIVHEVLHAISFNKHTKEEIFLTPLLEKHSHLREMQKSRANLFENGHWVESYLINDLMIPNDRIGTIFSIFTLELVEHLSEKIVGDRSKLPANFIFDQISNHKELFDHKCQLDEETPKYDIFCSKKEFESKLLSCSKDYRYKTTCLPSDSITNCRLRLPITSEDCMTSRDTVSNDFEKYGLESRCFEVVNAAKEHTNAGCFKFEFTADNDGTKLFIGHDTFKTQCKGSGDVAELVKMVTPKSGKIIRARCPNIDNFKHVVETTGCPSNCHYNGICVNKKCICMGSFDDNNDCETEKRTSDITFLVSRRF